MCNFTTQASQAGVPFPMQIPISTFSYAPQPDLSAFFSVAQGLSWGPIALLGIASLLSSSTVRDWLSKYLAIKGMENITGSLGKKCSNFIDSIGYRWGFGKTAAKERKKRAAKKKHRNRGVQTNRIKTLAEVKANNEKEIEKLRDEIKNKDQEIKSKIEESNILHKENAVLSTKLNALEKENLSIKDEKTVLCSELDKLRLNIHSTQVAATAQYSGAEECQKNLSKLYEKTKAELEQAQKEKKELFDKCLEDAKQIGQLSLLKQRVQELELQIQQSKFPYNVGMPELQYPRFNPPFNPDYNAPDTDDFGGFPQFNSEKPSFTVPKMPRQLFTKPTSFQPIFPTNTITTAHTSRQLDALDLVTRSRSVRMPIGALSYIPSVFSGARVLAMLPSYL